MNQSAPTAAHPGVDPLDFEDWSELAARDPDAFEARRAEAIEAFIQRAPAQRQPHLRRVQWKVDQVRRLARNPMDACLRLNRLMMDSVYGSGGLLETLERARGRDTGPRREARVLSFPAGGRRVLS